jgi:hypothetical protein
VPPQERPHTKRVREPVTGESVLMSKQPTFLPRRTRRDMSVKLPALKNHPTIQQSMLRKRILVQ